MNPIYLEEFMGNPGEIHGAMRRFASGWVSTLGADLGAKTKEHVVLVTGKVACGLTVGFPYICSVLKIAKKPGEESEGSWQINEMELVMG